MKRVIPCIAAIVLVAGCGTAPQTTSDVLQRASSAMGAEKVQTLRYAGSGSGASFGQAFRPGMAWPRLNYASYVRQADYRAPASSVEVVQSRAEPTGGGAVPLTGEARAATFVNGKLAWNQSGPLPAARPGGLAARLHDLWTTPHGVLKAAQRNNARAQTRSIGGRELTALTFSEAGVMTATAFIGAEGYVERVESTMPDQVLGDIAVVTTYSDYRDFDGVRFPMRVQQSAGGFPVLDLAIKDVQPNAEVNLAVPEVVRNFKENVNAEHAAPGVWLLTGGSHNSALIEMKDHAILVEAPLDDGRTLAVFDAARRLLPGKPVRYVVNSHNHFDHSGGLRAAAGEGATLVVQEQSKEYFEKAFANPNRISPDHLAKSGKRASIVGVPDGRLFEDGTRRVELHRVTNSVHADTFLAVFLPRERLLIEADSFTPGPPNAPAPQTPNALHVELAQTLERLNLPVERILPLHGRIVPIGELYRMIGK
jgi:glyoxylase-like metal-dependent hydrolase (beta-lactamase superfamily II)